MKQIVQPTGKFSPLTLIRTVWNAQYAKQATGERTYQDLMQILDGMTGGLPHTLIDEIEASLDYDYYWLARVMMAVLRRWKYCVAAEFAEQRHQEAYERLWTAFEEERRKKYRFYVRRGTFVPDPQFEMV